MDYTGPLHPSYMKKQWPFTFLLIGSCTAIVLLFLYTFYRASGSMGHRQTIAIATGTASRFSRTAMMAKQALLFCRRHHFNTSFCFLLDMSLPSGQNRFFVYNLEKDTVVAAGLVAHGSCGQAFATRASFSNLPGCGCSAAGRYKIGQKYRGSFGQAYKLYGLDSTNSNAFERNIVLHSYDLVPDKEVYPLPICNSKGCTMVSPAFLAQLSTQLDTSPRPVLLWVYQ